MPHDFEPDSPSKAELSRSLAATATALATEQHKLSLAETDIEQLREERDALILARRAASAETERLREALRKARSALCQAEHRLDDFYGTEAIQSVCIAATRDIDALLNIPERTT